MKNFIYELYIGNYHHECIKDKAYLEERNEKLDKASALEEKLCSTLSEEQKKLLQKLLNADADILIDEMDVAFARGVKIGMLLQTNLDKIEL